MQDLFRIYNNNKNITVKIRIDEDIIGLSESLVNRIELEYYWGPKFDDDISKIKPGVTVHHAGDETKSYEGIHAAQFWWKDWEERVIDGQVFRYRTFEAEELIENPSYGLSELEFGCRYVHSEYNNQDASINHFDGAIRKYGDTYLERLEKNLDRAGKHAQYTKLFRIDGKLSIQDWKTLTCSYFRGNDLFPEYFGADMSIKHELSSAASSETTTAASSYLEVFISISGGPVVNCDSIISDFSLSVGGGHIYYLEKPYGRLWDLLSCYCDTKTVVFVEHKDDILNFPRIYFAECENLQIKVSDYIKNISDCLAAEGEAHPSELSFSVSWAWMDQAVTLSIAGTRDQILINAHDISNIVKISLPPSDWITRLADLVKTTRARDEDPVNRVCLEGILALPHAAGDANIYMPKQVLAVS